MPRGKPCVDLRREAPAAVGTAPCLAARTARWAAEDSPGKRVIVGGGACASHNLLLLQEETACRLGEPWF